MRLHQIEGRGEVSEWEPSMGLRFFQVSIEAVKDEKLGILHTFPCLVSKLEWVCAPLHMWNNHVLHNCSPWRTSNATASGTVLRKRRRKRGRRQMPASTSPNSSSLQCPVHLEQNGWAWDLRKVETQFQRDVSPRVYRDWNKDLHITSFGPPPSVSTTLLSLQTRLRVVEYAFILMRDTVRLSWCRREYVPQILNFSVSHFVPSNCWGKSLSCFLPLFTSTRELTSRQPVSWSKTWTTIWTRSLLMLLNLF